MSKKSIPGFFFILAVFTSATYTNFVSAEKAAQASSPQVSTTLVISQVYGGGGSTSGTPAYAKDYVELKNVSAAAQSLSGLSLQYGSATGQFGSSAANVFALPVPRGRLYDFDGNGRTDWTTLGFGTTTSDGTPIRWKITGNPASAIPGAAFRREFQYGFFSDPINAADYVGDGKTEVSVWRSGIYYVAQFPTGTGGITLDRAVRWGQFGDIAGREGDYDGDGKIDYTIIRKGGNSLIWYMMSSSTNTMRAVQFGSSVSFVTIQTFPGADFTGDGRDELVLATADSVTGAVVYSIGDAVTGAGVATIQWGNRNIDSIIPPADYTGDGRADLVAWRWGGNGADACAWYIRNTATGAATGTQFGIGSNPLTNSSIDLAVRGDYDGDGRHDIAIYRQSNQTFYALSSSNGSLIFQKSGDGGDIPLANSRVLNAIVAIANLGEQ